MTAGGLWWRRVQRRLRRCELLLRYKGRGNANRATRTWEAIDAVRRGPRRFGPVFAVQQHGRDQHSRRVREVRPPGFALANAYRRDTRVRTCRVRDGLQSAQQFPE